MTDFAVVESVFQCEFIPQTTVTLFTNVSGFYHFLGLGALGCLVSQW